MAEREITAAVAWEMRFLEEQRKVVALRLQLAHARQQAAGAEARVAALDEAQRQQDHAAALVRFGAKDGDELIQRGEKFILVSADTPPAPPGVPPSTAGGKG
jgi:hypothetical protein